MVRRLLLLAGCLLTAGCAWPVRDATDQTVRELVEHPFDVAPDAMPNAISPAQAQPGQPTPSSSRSDAQGKQPLHAPNVVDDAAGTPTAVGPAAPRIRLQDAEVQPVAWRQPRPTLGGPTGPPGKYTLTIPPKVPGSEAPRIVLPRDREAAAREIERLYPELPPLPVQPVALPGPGGKPYSLEDFQRLAAANSPALAQAASDVEAAKGNLIQAKTYPNPRAIYLQQPTNVNNTAGATGAAIDQPIVMGGKLKLGAATAQKDLDNAVLALKRARSDLSTAVRNAYFTVLVDLETLQVTRALAQFSDDVYRLQTGLLKGTQASPYEPTALRAQTYLNRLAYKQAIAAYGYDWKALVATVGLKELPLSEIGGQVDRFFPYYDYDAVLAYALQNHTDVLTARNDVKRAQYVLKLAQVTPILQDLDVYVSLEKTFAIAPFGTYQPLTVAFPLSLWDQNKGNIIAAQGALIRAGEESHRVEVTLTSKLSSAHTNYKNNLLAMEFYRRNILPDLVRYYRGIHARRQVDPSSAFGDLVAAEEMLSANVSSYLGILGNLWSSVVGVADFLQTDDLYQVARRSDLPELPDFKQLRCWACDHASLATSTSHDATAAEPATEAPEVPDPPYGAGLESHRGAARQPAPRRDQAVQTAAWEQERSLPGRSIGASAQPDQRIPSRIPGSEAPEILISRERTVTEIDRIYPELPPLPVEPKEQPGPGGKPYTLADLQRLAASNSPTLRQAAADIEAAKGNLIQAKTLPNPTVAYVQSSSNNQNTSMETGGFISQPIIMGGKQKLGSAAAQKDLDNAILALKRARSDLSTAVRRAYFAVLVDVEALAITRALARFSDEIYRVQVGLVRGGPAAPYEPSGLRAQAFAVRLAYKQAIASYVYDWKTLVATLGLPQLPLSEVAGQVDRFIPDYDYDEVRAYVLRNHTDILTARNILRKSQYNLKLTQVTPLFPDLNVLLTLQKDWANPPFGTYQLMTVSFPLSIWDQNKGGIIAAQAAVVRASEESHRVEVALTSSLALAYEGYRNNLYAMEYYRRNVLPDLVRYYRGVFNRRQVDPNSAFGDLVTAQQLLSSNVTAYIGILGSLWSSAAGVADFLQTDDLFQVAKRRDLPELPDFSQLSHWACGHDSVAAPRAYGPDVLGRPARQGEPSLRRDAAVDSPGVRMSDSGSASERRIRVPVQPVAPVGSGDGKEEGHEGPDR
jgi:cobalt-zinc-cadmium efflux system outer membrane protein